LKKSFRLICFLLLVSVQLIAQNIPTGIPFQGIAKDFHGEPINERKIFIQTSLIAGSINGIAILKETHQTTTDHLGIFSILIGQGSKTSGSINSLIDLKWDQGPYYLNIKLAITPNAPIINWQYAANWVDMGTTPLGIVPYAFYAVQTSGLQAKLNASDTTQMLRDYVKTHMIKLLDSVIGSKLSTTDTMAMLAPYVKAGENVTNTITASTPTTNNTFSGDYNDLTGKPTLFSGAYKDLTGIPILFDQEYASLKNKPVLFSGTYADLIGKPSLFDGNYNDLSNKPLLFNGDYLSLINKPILFSGSYTDLLNKPLLFSGIYTDLIGKPNLFDGDYNTLSNKPVLTLNGDITNAGNTTTLALSGVASGTYGNGLNIPVLSIDEKGRITSASMSSITPNSFPNKTNAEKLAMSNTTATGTIIWCSNCGVSGQMQVYNGVEWTDMIGGTALSNNIIFGTIATTTIGSTTASITNSISSDGGNTISARGVVWNTSINPTIALSTKVSSGTGTGTFNVSISSLSASTVYYIRSYATNSNGTVYGNEISFTTTGIVPSLTTSTASNISVNAFTIGGSITNDGGNLVTYRGICWSTSANPTTSENKIISGTGTGTYSVSIAGLNVATVYYVRAFATNSAGTAYGNQQTITTASLTAGTSYLGGKIAYLFQAGDAGYVANEKHGFIIMNHPMGMTAVYGGYNSSTGYFSYSNTSTGFGTGLSNTLKLYNLTGNNAAKYIYNVSYDGYNDWYIPSSTEWTKIATNWSSLGIPYGYYQCSSEVSQQNSYLFSAYISYGWISASVSNSGKTSLYDIIGIRNF
jgi:hypothetical protein